MKRFLIAFFLLWAFPALAQQSVYTIPTGQATASNASSTIAVTNTFQSVFAANVVRKDCLIQNKGANNMYVFFGAAASATTATAILLLPNWAITCVNGGMTNNDAVFITGTASDGFYASQQ